MDQQKRQVIKKYCSLLLERKNIIGTFFLMGIFLGLFIYLQAPKMYQSKSLIRYLPLRGHSSVVFYSGSEDVPMGTEEVAAVIRQITERGSLEPMIKEYNLYAEAVGDLPMENIVATIRSQISIVHDRGSDIVRVSFRGRDPERVLQVTKALSAMFLAANTLSPQQGGAAGQVQGGEGAGRFSIVEPAQYPGKPTQPDFQKIMLQTVGLGLGVGCGLALGLGLADTSFKDPAELEDYLEVPVVCTVPVIESRSEKKLKRLKTIIWTVLVFIVLGLLVAVAGYFANQGG